ncbi:hypothetical protein HanPI659440_Chr01g0028201 [Helianthus annuus]|nr:hypothetical protein HanPI659440_Chr01g0028201 [Helianthus annuus]
METMEPCIGLLGAIPPLIKMLDSGDLDHQFARLLLNIRIGNDTLKEIGLCAIA